MKFYRGIFAGVVFCTSWVGAAFGASVPTRTVSAGRIETGYSGAQSGGGMNDKLCAGKKVNDPCSDKTKTGICQIQKDNGRDVLTCVRKSCRNENGYYLSYYKDSTTGAPTRSKGICRHKSFCKTGYELKTYNLNGVIVTTDDCVKDDNKCTNTELDRLYAQTGINHELNAEHTQDLDGNSDVICMPTKCIPGYVLENANQDDAKCVPCKSCQPTNATCELTGGDGISRCDYNTRCIDGYGDIQNMSKYNPICSEIKYADVEEPKIDLDVPDDDNVPVETPMPNVEIPTEEEEAEEDVYQIRYNLDGGAGCDTAYGYADDTIDCVPKRDGFNFDGWCYDAGRTDCENGGEFTVKPTDADTNKITMYAKWTAVQSPVVPQRTECLDEEKAQFPHATEFKFADDKCLPTACEAEYKLENGKCVDDGIKGVEDDYKRARDNETSLENRLWSAGAMAATGLGGMELARGLAEKKADKDAEADMEAYMENFRCEVGNDKNILGQTKNITTPGANQLINLYQSYVDLAASLKQRKADLGLRPGIEAEVVLDKSVVGLYDDKGNGVQNGTYASLYRAEMGSEADKQKLDTQSDASTRRVWGGGVVAGVGAVGGAYKNIKINKDSVDSDSGVLNQAAGLFLGK